MDRERINGAGEELEVEDEFACAGMLRGSLTSLHSTVERIFRVRFAIGTEQQPHGNDGQIWLKLQGPSANVEAAKLFVKGLVNQEEQQELSYPGVLHCVFCGARGLFLDCLIRTTSALVVVGSPGFLLISGLTEPVVRAYSLITDLVERYEGAQSSRTEPGDRDLGESLESRRAFKNLVEQWDDRHTLDLLVLPGSIKEILLDLVEESGIGDNPRPLFEDKEKREDTWDKLTSIGSFGDGRISDRWGASSGNDSLANDSFLRSLGDSGGERVRPEGAEGQLKSPQEVGEEEQLGIDEDVQDEKEQHLQLSGGKEFWLLLKFFTAMGYTEDVVQRVLAKTGLQEASQILDLVQQEQDRSDRERKESGEKSPKTQDDSTSKETERNRPCETEHRDEGETVKRQAKREISEDSRLNGATGGFGELKDDDFVLGVLKKAAASCGYNEKQVSDVYTMLPDRSMRQLLLQLQKKETRPTDYFKEGPREMDDVVIERDSQKNSKMDNKVKERKDRVSVVAENRDINDRGSVKLPKRCASGAEQDSSWQTNQHKKVGTNGPPKEIGPPEVRGPPLSMYTTSNDLPNVQRSKQFISNVFPLNPPASDHYIPKKTQPHFKKTDWSQTGTREKKGFTPQPSSSVVVTGEQRFLEGLHLPFELQLTDQPGDPKLRTVIIDGSNVAMSHGLGHFFSCRGIALAVQHFWDRGHRQISALVPQWRTKTDSRIKEQHYLTELNKLGLVSYTPSREVQGKRISSYDDRLMLQLSQKTNGVIVTNDNLRDLSDESPAFTDIIKKRLLQYTFVGDHFMVPDDPLGRGGPHLDEFLSTEHRSPDQGNTYSAVSSSSSSKVPRSQTDLVNYRDRSPGAAWGSTTGRRRGGRDAGHQGQNWLGAGPGAGLRPERTPEETFRLREELCQIFPGQDSIVTLVLQCHSMETDINTLSGFILEEDKD